MQRALTPEAVVLLNDFVLNRACSEEPEEETSELKDLTGTLLLLLICLSAASIQLSSNNRLFVVGPSWNEHGPDRSAGPISAGSETCDRWRRRRWGERRDVINMTPESLNINNVELWPRPLQSDGPTGPDPDQCGLIRPSIQAAQQIKIFYWLLIVLKLIRYSKPSRSLKGAVLSSQYLTCSRQSELSLENWRGRSH